MYQALLFFIFLFFNYALKGQVISGKLIFKEDQAFSIDMKISTVVTQQVMENAIDFTAHGTALHNYKVKDITPGNTTLHHQANKITFEFKGMGQERKFDSDNEQDMAGQFGQPVKEILSKTYDMTIDTNGKVIRIQPEKMEALRSDERLTIVLQMLNEIFEVVYPPQKGESSFFKIVPSGTVEKGERWTDSLQKENGKYIMHYSLSDITDTTLIIEFNSTAVSHTKAMMMGRETTTTINSTSTGKVIVDKSTGIVKEKLITTISNGTTEAMGGTLPMTAKTTIIILVKPD